MKKLLLLIMLLLWACIFTACRSDLNDAESTDKPSFVLLDFEESFSADQIIPDDAVFELSSINNNRILTVHTGISRSKPGVVIKQSPNHPWNLAGYYQVQADVENLGDEEIQVEMFVGDDPDGLIKWYCSDYVDLKPQEKKTITVDLSWTPWVFSPQLDIVGMRGIPGKIKTDISNIDELSFYSRYATQENSFAIKSVRAVGKVDIKDTTGFFPFIDQYGQYLHKDWKGKINADQDLKVMAQAEAAVFTKQPGPQGLSQYGGWASGPKLEATGFFRAEKYEEKWYMVDPEGYLFWSAGINCVSSETGLTGIEGRKHYFQNLPKKENDLGKFYTQGGWSSHGFYMDKVPFEAYNFYQANVYRKYGENWAEKFRETIHKRYKNWGLNTIGNVSDMVACQQQKTPYVGTVWINGTPKIEGSNGYWGKFHDVFDPQFRSAVRTSMELQKSGAEDPWCMGFFVDNEMSWGDLGSLSIGVLQSPANQAAKQEFINDLKAKYTSITRLNNQWGTDHSSWQVLLNSTQVPDEQRASEDLISFYQKIAETYFRTIKEELNRIAPNQYYLGCRFAWANNEVTIKAASDYCDIISFNKYEYSVENVHLPAGIDKPIMIGEFHFGALDRGLFHVGVKKAATQEERGKMYKTYIEGALRNDAIVGAHWFQYVDEPTTGREDGENYNVGLVDICDTPYEELIQKIREVTYTMYEYRAGKKALLGKISD